MSKQSLRLTAWAAACALCLFSFPGICCRENAAKGEDAWIDFVSGSLDDDLKPAVESMPHQMTMEDIQALNPDATVIDIYNNEGYLSLRVGKFYDGRVSDMEEGIEAIRGMASLLGFGKRWSSASDSIFNSVSEKAASFLPSISHATTWAIHSILISSATAG